jgi:hypothetical protein
MSIAAKIAPTARRPPRHLYSVNLKASVGPSLSLYVAQRSSSTVVTRPSGAAVAFLFGPNAVSMAFRVPAASHSPAVRHSAHLNHTNSFAPPLAHRTQLPMPHIFSRRSRRCVRFKFAHSVQTIFQTKIC